MSDNRIKEHPILEVPKGKLVRFTWNGQEMQGKAKEPISSALIANGVKVFGHHHKDHSPQGLFCANGQCSQCLVIADGRPVKSCMVPLAEGMQIEAVEGLPRLPQSGAPPVMKTPPDLEVEVLIIGGGPAGLAAAVELGRLGVDTLVLDDKDRLGGKLLLQTHKFFGSVADSRAGTRGYEIARILEDEIATLDPVQTWLRATVVGVFSDQVVGVVKGNLYRRIKPQRLLIATGAREKMLSFPGNTLPGIFGAGAFQTLVNRDLVKCSKRVLIVGGGNVGLITGYHSIQAGIPVAALVEALPHCGGYKVHEDKLRRLGVPIYTSHTVVSAQGGQQVESVTIAALDSDWQVVPDTHKTFAVDTVLIAVGLNQVDEFYHKARKWGLPVWAAGDAHEIAEASSAMFSGKITGLKIAQSLGLYSGEIPKEWDQKAEILKARPGQPVAREKPQAEEGVFPVLHCVQEIPCNPCTSVCPSGAIKTENNSLLGLPYFDEAEKCKGCMSCVAICPGLAITMVDFRQDPEHPIVTFPYEIWRQNVEVGAKVPLTDQDGAWLGRYPVSKVIDNPKKYPGTLLVQVKVDKEVAKKAAGIGVEQEQAEPMTVYEHEAVPDEAIICRCERVTAGEVRQAIRSGITDFNHLKALLRVGMGSCGSKTCRPLVHRLFKEEG
ncbi:MAG: FAD-dependent oxidoreductase, partial [Desulfarculaceae bacterium]